MRALPMLVGSCWWSQRYLLPKCDPCTPPGDSHPVASENLLARTQQELRRHLRSCGFGLIADDFPLILLLARFCGGDR
jgi:hypothetical protein